MGLIEAVIFLGLLSPQGDGSSLAKAARFETWFVRDISGALTVPGSVARAASTFRFVFVGGFRNERMPGYFAQNVAELRAQGVPRGQIHVIHPSSGRTPGENAAAVRSRFLAIAAEGPERLVIIGHSRGACDSLLFAIGNASFVQERVEALFLIQGPFGGSGLADHVVGRGTPLDRRMPWAHRVVGNLFGRLARAFAGTSGLHVLEGMTRAASREFWDKALSEHAGSVALVGPKTFFVRSQVSPPRLRFVRRALASYLAAYHGPSDGMVAMADQMLPGLGAAVATLEAGHPDLTQRFPASRAPRRLRRALIRSILMTVGRPDLSDVADQPGG